MLRWMRPFYLKQILSNQAVIMLALTDLVISDRARQSLRKQVESSLRMLDKMP